MDKYLKLTAKETVKTWIKCNLANHLKKNEVHNNTEIEHIIDYLNSDDAPKRLARVSYPQAVEASIKWTASLNKAWDKVADLEGDTETVYTFKDGFTIKKLTTKKALQREGVLMSHCVGSYDPNETSIYSLRDKKNEPHATMEITTDKVYGDDVNQVKGKGNGSVNPKYVANVLEFLDSIGKSVRPSEMENLGYIEVESILVALFKQDTNAQFYTDKEGREFLFKGGEKDSLQPNEDAKQRYGL